MKAIKGMKAKKMRIISGNEGQTSHKGCCGELTVTIPEGAGAYRPSDASVVPRRKVLEAFSRRQDQDHVPESLSRSILV